MIISWMTFISFGIMALILLIRYLLEWKRRNLAFSLLPGPKKQHLILGDLPLAVRKAKSNRINLHRIIFDFLLYLTQKYRKEGICRIWLGNDPNIVLFSAETMKSVLTSQNLVTKSRLYNMLHCWLGTGLLTSSGKKWRERRKLLTSTFHYRILDEFVPVFNNNSKTFVKNMNEIASKGPIDIVPHVSLLTLDIICETAMGINIGAQKANAAEYVKAISRFSSIFMKRSVIPWLRNNILFSYTSDGPKLNNLLKILLDFSMKIIKQKKQEFLNKIESAKTKGTFKIKEVNLGKKKGQALLDLLLLTQFTENSITDEGISEEVDTFMFEGHDTTAAAISWAFYHLGCHPEIQQKVYEELQRIFGDDKDREITSQDLKEMKYLECVIKECLRLSPSVPLFQRVVSEEINIKGYTIPRNTTLTLFVYSLHRDPVVFPNPEQFDPDRFLPENCIGRHPFAYLPFSAGPRNCIGQKFAMMEMKITICHALRNFVFESVESPNSIEISALLILRSMKGLWLKLTKREK